MEQFLQKNKWSILAAGAAIQILTGIPAAWGVFQGPVRQEYGFDEGAASFILVRQVVGNPIDKINFQEISRIAQREA